MLFANAYEGDDKGNLNRLIFWLSLDEWSLNEATLISLDLDPDSLQVLKNGQWSYFISFSGYFSIDHDMDDGGFPIPVGVTKDGLNIYLNDQQSDKLIVLQNIFNDRKRLLGRFAKAKPTEWIDVAIEKNLSIRWLDWAKSKGYFEPKIIQKVNNKLSNLERETLLVIIATLAKEAKVDILKISKAGQQIAYMTEQLGTSIGATTIETHLKKIPQALESRSK